MQEVTANSQDVLPSNYAAQNNINSAHQNMQVVSDTGVVKPMEPQIIEASSNEPGMIDEQANAQRFMRVSEPAYSNMVPEQDHNGVQMVPQ